MESLRSVQWVNGGYDLQNARFLTVGTDVGTYKTVLLFPNFAAIFFRDVILRGPASPKGPSPTERQRPQDHLCQRKYGPPIAGGDDCPAAGVDC
jgi:hypothetical protein